MKKSLLKIKLALIALGVSTSFFAQTSGTLTFTYTPTSHTGYSGTKNVLSVWIEDANGNFVKSRVRYAGWGTADHLPIWAVAAGGSSGNCMTGCNTTGATTGATLTSFATRTIAWDGTDASGNVVADGTYKIIIESCWNHGTTNKDSRSFSFTKGTATDTQTPTDDANFTSISLEWSTAVGIEDHSSELLEVKVYPNPSVDGTFKVEYTKADNIKVLNMVGEVVYNESLLTKSGIKNIDLSNSSNGVYFVYVSDGAYTSKHKVVLSK